MAKIQQYSESYSSPDQIWRCISNPGEKCGLADLHIELVWRIFRIFVFMYNAGSEFTAVGLTLAGPSAPTGDFVMPGHNTKPSLETAIAHSGH